MKRLATWSDVEIGEVPDGPTFTRLGLRMGDGEQKFIGLDILRADGTRLCRLNIFEFANGRGDVDVILEKGQTGKLVLIENGVRLPVPDTANIKVFGVDIK